MKMNEYQRRTRLTRRFPPTLPEPVYCALGLAGEAGELLNKLKKVYRDDGGQVGDPRGTEIAMELGDCLWYIASLADVLGVPLEDIAQANLKKLSGRLQAGTIHGDGEGTRKPLPGQMELFP